jgi:SAM-dependent methyltransferase
VIALDVSPEMIALARARLASCGNVELVLAGATAWRFPEEELDCAVSIATLHHLPFEETLSRLARSLVPGGILVVHDLFRDAGLLDRALYARRGAAPRRAGEATLEVALFARLAKAGLIAFRDGDADRGWRPHPGGGGLRGARVLERGRATRVSRVSGGAAVR